jgi:hypothetical protein
MAEETVIAHVLREPALLGSVGALTGKQFSVELMGRVFDALRERYRQGLDVSLSVLTELTDEEISHLTGVCQKQSGPVNEKAFRDCVGTILRENAAKQVDSDEDLMAFRNKLKERKGTGT